MLIFLTGATGFLGRALIPELLSHSHTILALSRSPTSSTLLTALGCTPHPGSLTDLDSLRRGAQLADAVIHLAFIVDFADFAGAAATDAKAIEAMGDVMQGTGKPLVIASGTMITVKGRVADEDTEMQRTGPLAARCAGADAVYKLSAEKGVRGSVVRLAPTVHDVEDHGFVAMLINTAEKVGHATYIGSGEARWPAVHRRDAAVLFRLVVEKGEKGATYNAVAEEGVSTRDIARVVGGKIGVEVRGMEVQEGMKELGFLAFVLGTDNPTSSERTKEELEWEPREMGLLEDVEKNYSSEMRSKFA
jgi:nucleoside-diphosphate-sugar epimerase